VRNAINLREQVATHAHDLRMTRSARNLSDADKGTRYPSRIALSERSVKGASEISRLKPWSVHHQGTKAPSFFGAWCLEALVALISMEGKWTLSHFWRPLVIPESDISDHLTHPNCPARKQLLSPNTENLPKKRACRPRNYSLSELMRRVFSIDVLACPCCGGRMRIIAAIQPPPEAIRKILDCLGLPSRPPPIARALPEREIDRLNFS